jgi:hypothetical protein
VSSSRGATRRRSVIATVALLLFVSLVAPVLASSDTEEAPLVEPDAITAAAEDARVAEAAQEQAFERQLETPVAERQREESQTAYGNLPPGEAENLLSIAFPEQIGALEADPARLIGDLHVQKKLGTYGALVSDEEGGSVLVETPVPLEAGLPGADREPVDLALEAVGSGFAPESPLTDVRLPGSAGGAIQLPHGIAVDDLPGSDGSDARRFGDSDLFYAETDAATDTLLSPTTGGVEIFEQLRAPESPEQFRYGLELPAGASLRSDGQGGAEVVADSGSAIALVPAPTAVDAQGVDVPVTMSVEGQSLVLDVPHRSRDLAYPLLVDPEVIEHWESWNAGYNTYALGYWVWGESSAGVGYEHSTGCIVTCWGSGLYSRSRGSNYFYPANSWGQFVYPGSRLDRLHQAGRLRAQQRQRLQLLHQPAARLRRHLQRLLGRLQRARRLLASQLHRQHLRHRLGGRQRHPPRRGRHRHRQRELRPCLRT